MQKAAVNIYGRITTMTRRMAVTPFEDTVTVDTPTEYLQEYCASAGRSIRRAVPLPPGNLPPEHRRPRTVGGNMNDLRAWRCTVPRLDAEKVTASTLVLADMIEKVPATQHRDGACSSSAAPRFGRAWTTIFKRDEKMGIYMKIYNLGADENTHKPSGEVEYEIVKKGSNEKIVYTYRKISRNCRTPRRTR